MSESDPPSDSQPAKKSRGQRDARRTNGQGRSGRSSPGGKRHQARILALQVLFEVDLTDHDPGDVLRRTFEDQPTPSETRRHVERLVNGTLTDQEEIDQYVFAAAPQFPVTQLPSIDRNVLRLAIFELLRERDVPVKAAINEAVELAKRFGGDSSSRFVNGVLGTVVSTITRDRAPETPPASTT